MALIPSFSVSRLIIDKTVGGKKSQRLQVCLSAGIKQAFSFFCSIRGIAFHWMVIGCLTSPAFYRNNAKTMAGGRGRISIFERGGIGI
jgi:hypothetical protein